MAFFATLSQLEERSFRKSARQHVWEFACLFALIFMAIAGYRMALEGELSSLALSLLALAFLFLSFGKVLPQLLYPFWKAWMALGHGIGVVVSAIILTLMWIGVVLPISFLLRIVGKRVMDLRFDRKVESYWEDRDPGLHDFQKLERMF